MGVSITAEALSGSCAENTGERREGRSMAKEMAVSVQVRASQFRIHCERTASSTW